MLPASMGELTETELNPTHSNLNPKPDAKALPQRVLHTPLRVAVVWVGVGGWVAGMKPNVDMFSSCVS